MKVILLITTLFQLIFGQVFLFGQYLKNELELGNGQFMEMTYFGHASLLFKFKSYNLYIDPYGKVADYRSLPKADLILITHQHGDHLDRKAIDALVKQETIIVVNKKGSLTLNDLQTIVLENGGEYHFKEVIKIRAVPAYNIKHLRPSGEPFHSRGEGNGYLLFIQGKTFYIAGDTENIPELNKLPEIDYAFFPLNLPYTMNVEMFLDAAKRSKSNVVFPYHSNPQMVDDLKTKWTAKDLPELRLLEYQ